MEKIGVPPLIIACSNNDGFVDHARAAKAVREFFAQNDYTGKRLLLITPDNTRSGPIGEIFQMIFDCASQKAAAVDVLIALGTHQPISDEQICKRFCITPEQRRGKYASVKFFNHQWDRPDTFTSIGKITAGEVSRISGGLFSEEVDISINKLIYNYDQLLIIGPVFPHEVVGFSGGHKYLFPGIAGDQIINFFHWLGAIITNPRIDGNKWTPTREVVEKAASFITVPRKLFAIVAVEGQMKGLFIGNVCQAWERAADMSEKLHIVYLDKPCRKVLGIAPAMYDDLWTAGKVMYKLEPVIADGGTLIIYAPHVTEISYTHGRVIDYIGYHTRDYFLKQMDQFVGVPRGVIAHSTHVKGIGTFIDGVEKPRINVILATGIPQQRCEKVNLGYMNSDDIDIDEYENRQDEDILVVHHAGELLYRLSGGRIPGIENE